MLTKVNTLVDLAVAIVLVGASLDALPSASAQVGGGGGPPPPPPCDNLCRNKNVIYYCDGGTNPCIQYENPTCLVCNADLYGGAKQCETDGTGTTDTCDLKPLAPQVPYLYMNCSTNCACGAGVPTVDAFANSAASGGGNTSVYTCGGR